MFCVWKPDETLALVFEIILNYRLNPSSFMVSATIEFTFGTFLSPNTWDSPEGIAAQLDDYILRSVGIIDDRISSIHGFCCRVNLFHAFSQLETLGKAIRGVSREGVSCLSPMFSIPFFAPNSWIKLPLSTLFQYVTFLQNIWFSILNLSHKSSPPGLTSHLENDHVSKRWP